jgi:LPXTG-site transpeptidase (sortase) family protein
MGPRLTTLVALVLIAFGVFVLLTRGPFDVVQAPPTPTASATTVATSSPPSPTESARATQGPRAIPDGYRVQVPRLRIDLPIKEGDVTRDIDDQQTPEHAAFHLPRTAIPGDGSNTYLYAHARTGMFLSLWDAKEGDEVIIVAPDGKTLAYVVREVHPRVPYNETSWVLPSPTERLTLQTSTGPNPQDPRFVVVALPK